MNMQINRRRTENDVRAGAVLWWLIGAALAGIACSWLCGCASIEKRVDKIKDGIDARIDDWGQPETPPAKPETPDKPETPAKPETPDKPETPTQPEAPPTGDNTFLWKPVSESRGGRCAVITPAKLTVKLVKLNGVNDTAEYAGRANGNRQHFFQRKTGSAYGRNVSVEAIDASGAVLRKWTVPDGGARWGSN